MIFLTHSLRLPDFFLGEVFFAERLHDFFVEILRDLLY